MDPMIPPRGEPLRYLQEHGLPEVLPEKETPPDEDMPGDREQNEEREEPSRTRGDTRTPSDHFRNVGQKDLKG